MISDITREWHNTSIKLYIFPFFLRPLPCPSRLLHNLITKFCHPQSDEIQTSLMMITVIAAQFVFLQLFYHLQLIAPHPPTPPPPPSLSNLPQSSKLSPSFQMQLRRAVCYWFPWCTSKINIKVCDGRAAYWFNRLNGCSCNVSTFDLWPVFVFFWADEAAAFFSSEDRYSPKLTPVFFQQTLPVSQHFHTFSVYV